MLYLSHNILLIRRIVLELELWEPRMLSLNTQPLPGEPELASQPAAIPNLRGAAWPLQQ